ncbi:hypothetical protein [Sporosarcina limicola]|uniref:Uncharacterized protein n=1 Tax=Sporosarcina limicola TaxID=34101 RepID=A0A927MHA2_9BACL|nr:hypothetical protein [Sporosarcina limicola]MBE1553761.1 hypothetical protein [Sporosarcina limicola]
MNEDGYSWPEAILTLTVVLLIFGTLLPLASTMTLKLQLKKSEMHATEAALQGAILYSAYGLVGGIRHVNGMDYDWTVEGNSICVTYKVVEKVTRRCVN